MAVRREVETVRANAGTWLRDDYTVLRVTGSNAGTWLHAQTTNDVLALSSGAGCANALLDRTGRVQAAFTTHRWENEFWLVLEKDFVRPFLDRVESHVFLEDIHVSDVGEEGAQIAVEGPRAIVLLSQLGGSSPEETASGLPTAAHAFAPIRLLEQDLLAFRMSETGLDGYMLLVDAADAKTFGANLAAELESWGAVVVSEAARACLGVEGGRLRAGHELTGREIINETPLDETAVSAAKGCYLGQEVVARLRSYGSPKRMLMALIMRDDGGAFPAPGETLRVDGKRVGTVCSHTFSPTLDRWLALAYLGRDHRAAGRMYRFDGGEVSFTAEVRPLPLIEVPDRRALAEERYGMALAAFEADADDQDDTAIGLLKEAILLAPDFEDAFESLGVILHRHQRVDEAIHYMRLLARMNPNSVMVHANLSVFYVTQGRIQEAEEEKARAAQLEQSHELDTRRAAHAAAAERERIRGEATERIRMFHEVLEIDAEDPVATMGLGTAHMQLEEYDRALPFLRTAVRANPDYSAAYLNLGKCLEFLGDGDGAHAVYEQGVEAAGRKGDFMPLREMERRMAGLRQDTG